MAQYEPHSQVREGDQLPPPGVQLPNEPYYQRPQRGPNRRPLGVALIVVGLIWLLSSAIPKPPIFGDGPGGQAVVLDRTVAARRLVLNAGSASVELIPGNRAGIHVEAIRQGGSNADFNVNLQQDGETLQISHTSAPCVVFCARRLRYRIELPPDTPAVIQSTSGTIDAEGLTGGVDISTTSGEATLRGIRGPLALQTVSGDVSLRDGLVSGANLSSTSGSIDVSGISGAIVVRTVSGSIEIDQARDAQLSVETSSGDISYNGSLAAGGQSRINSVSGDVTLSLPEQAGLTLDVSTVSGSLDTSLAVQGVTETRAIRGKIGDGAAQVTITTTSGDVSLERQ